MSTDPTPLRLFGIEDSCPRTRVLFPLSAARDAVHQLRGKPVYLDSTGQRVGEIQDSYLSDGTKRITFVPGTSIEASGAAVYVAVTCTEALDLSKLNLVPLWAGPISEDATGASTCVRPLFYGALLVPVE